MSKQHKNDVVHDAEKIADLVIHTTTEERGDLLHGVATILGLKGQHYTAMLFEQLAREYGCKIT